MKKIGIIGGGQLGKMMILDGKRLDTQFSILDPTEHCRRTASPTVTLSRTLMMWTPSSAWRKMWML